MRNKRHQFTVAVGLSLVGVLGVVFVSGYWIIDRALSPVQSQPTFKTIYIPKGYKGDQIADVLVANRLIRSRTAFLWWIRFSGKGSKLWAGYYSISPHFSIPFIATVLTEHTVYSRLVRVTIPEGYSLLQIAETLQRANLVKSDAFVQYVRADAKLQMVPQFSWLTMIPTRNMEGLLYPDTYLFSPGASKQVIIKSMLTAFEKHIVSLWPPNPNTSSRSGLNFYNTLVLASVIEKEAVINDEMPVISGVFHRRLKRHMPLGSDPTVVYAHGVAWKKVVYYKDLEIKSPYNTYKNKGLPPTPIASPGKSAFLAAMNPATGNALFFVAAKDGSGRHIFTKTYRDHLRVQKTK